MKLGIVGLPNVGKSTLLMQSPRLVLKRQIIHFARSNPMWVS